MHRIISILILVLPLLLLSLTCSSDEDDGRPPVSSPALINVTFENARVIEVDAARHRALLLHTSESSSGTAIELVDTESRDVISSRILDYFDVYDLKFVNANEACFAGRPHGHIGYAVHFFSLPDLTLGTRVMTSDTSGTPGFLAVDSLGGMVYYSHAGGGDKDAIYKIRVSNKLLVDADNDGLAPFSLDNDLVSGLFGQPGKLFYDRDTQKLVVANLSDNIVTWMNASLWGTLDRAANLTFPINGTMHLPTGNSRPVTMAFGAGVYVFAGMDGGQSYMGRFTMNSQEVDILETFAGRTWKLGYSNIRIHPRDDLVSIFILEEDTAGIAIGQYRLNNLVEATASPYRTHHLPDSVVTSFGLDAESDHLLVANGEDPRLEIIDIE